MHVLIYCLGTCCFSTAVLLNILCVCSHVLVDHFVLLPILIFFIFPIIDTVWIMMNKGKLQHVRENTLTGPFPEHTVPIITCVLSIFTNIVCLIASSALPLTSLQLLTLIFTMGLLNVTTVAASHELFHRLNKYECWLGKLHLTVMSYTHFALGTMWNLYNMLFLEHVYGHHKHVGTEHDPATAIKGQSLYHFVPQSVARQWKKSWERECKFLHVKQISEYHPYYNRMILYALACLCYIAIIYQFLGTRACMVHVAQSLIAIWLTETVNYFEH